MPRHDDDDDDEPIVATLNGVRFGFVAMIRELRSIVRVGDSAPRGLMRVVQRRCFTGADLVTALLGKHPSDLGREAAAAFASRGPSMVARRGCVLELRSYGELMGHVLKSCASRGCFGPPPKIDRHPLQPRTRLQVFLPLPVGPKWRHLGWTLSTASDGAQQ